MAKKVKNDTTEPVKKKLATDGATTTAIQPESFKAWVEEFTGGPGGCQVQFGGTCIRPDIFLNNNRTCDLCECVEVCLCSSKKLIRK